MIKHKWLTTDMLKSCEIIPPVSFDIFAIQKCELNLNNLVLIESSYCVGGGIQAVGWCIAAGILNRLLKVHAKSDNYKYKYGSKQPFS